jgi:hypothetical protein
VELIFSAESMDSWFFLPLFPAGLIQLVAGPEGAKNLVGESPPPDSNPFNSVEFGENLASSSSQFAATPNHRFYFHKRRQLFIGMHNETLSVVAMCVSVYWRPLFAIAEVRSSPNSVATRPNRI